MLLARYDLSKDASTGTVVIFGNVHRHGGECKFRAVGPSGLRGIVPDLEVSVSSSQVQRGGDPHKAIG